MNVRALADAVTARVGVPQFATYRSELITARPAKGYAVFWFGAGTSHNVSLAAKPARLRWQFRVTCVGYTDDHCLYIAQLVRWLLVGYRPDPDPAAGPINEVDDDPPLIRDDVEGDVRYSVSLRFSLFTRLDV